MKRDKLGRFSATKKIDLTTNLILVVDESSSMIMHTTSVKNEISRQRTIHQNNLSEDSCIITFNGLVRPPQKITNSVSYNPFGGTALNDAIYEACSVRFNRKIPTLIMIITDGEENASLRSIPLVKNAIDSLPKNVTVAIIGPSSVERYSNQLGIPRGNVQIWDPTTSFNNVSNSIDAGVNNYYALRSAGNTSVQSFFANVDLGVVNSKLVESTNRYDVWPVAKDCNIDSFVNERLVKYGQTYQKGRAFYELSKPEDVQATKEIVVRTKDGKIYDGIYARQAIGIPNNTKVKLKPGNINGCKVFVQSTSINRKLISGTEVLYR